MSNGAFVLLVGFAAAIILVALFYLLQATGQLILQGKTPQFSSPPHSTEANRP